MEQTNLGQEYWPSYLLYFLTKLDHFSTHFDHLGLILIYQRSQLHFFAPQISHIGSQINCFGPLSGKQSTKDLYQKYGKPYRGLWELRRS